MGSIIQPSQVPQPRRGPCLYSTMLLPILSIIAPLLLLPLCLASEQQGVTGAELASEPLATETAKSEREDSPTASGSFLSSKDFENGAKYNEELGSQDNSTKREHFEQAMRFHQEEDTPVRKRGTVLRAVSKRWPNGEVPYILEDAFDEKFRAIIAAAMADVHERTCIRWREKTEDDKDWVYIYTTGAQGCVATLGYVGPGHGQHNLALRSGQDGGCNDKGVVIHEMMHNLGVGHEQNRPDRNSLMSIDWTNIPIDKANQHFRHNWITDTENLPKCTEEGQVQDTANFDNCVSGMIVEDFGVGYDKDSIMHYGITLFAIDDTKPVLIPKDSSITSLGGYELTDMDVLKLQKAYGCNGACGGWAKSERGGDLDGKSSDNESPCEWILETSPGKGIEIAIIKLTGPTDCSTDYLEVRLGDSKEGQLVGKYCSSAGSVKINNHKIWVKWVRSSGSSPTLTATWNTFAYSCCAKVILENLDGQSSSQGYFWKQEERYEGYNLFKQEDGENYLFQIATGWIVSDAPPFDKDSWRFGVKNKGMEACPESASGAWQYYGSSTSTGEGAWISDPDGALRCSDCNLFPAADECAECCSEIVGSTTSPALNPETNFLGSFLVGNWVAKLMISTHIRCTSRQKWRTTASSSTTNSDGLWPTVQTCSRQACLRIRAPRNAFVRPWAGGRTLAAILRMSMSPLHVLEETQVHLRQEQHWPQPLSCRQCSASPASWSMQDPTNSGEPTLLIWATPILQGMTVRTVVSTRGRRMSRCSALPPEVFLWNRALLNNFECFTDFQ